MSAKVNLFYETEAERVAVLEALRPMISKVRLYPSKGRFKRAYITIKPTPSITERPSI